MSLRALLAEGRPVRLDGGLSTALEELLTESVRLARRAGVPVAASVAPYGASLAGGQEYTGDYDVPAGWHERRLRQLLEADAIAIETQPRLDEAVTKTWSGDASACAFEGAQVIGGCCGWGPSAIRALG